MGCGGLVDEVREDAAPGRVHGSRQGRRLGRQQRLEHRARAFLQSAQVVSALERRDQAAAAKLARERDELARDPGIIVLDQSQRRRPPLVQFADLEFRTPSGRIEIASERAAADGHPRVPQPSHDPRPAAGRLRLLSPASRWQMNDSYGNDPTILEKLGPAAVTLHPDDARALGLAAGDRVRLVNETGALTLGAAISDEVPRGAALSHKGRWPGLEAEGGNVNRLNPGEKSDMGESSCVHGTLVEVQRAEPGADRGV